MSKVRQRQRAILAKLNTQHTTSVEQLSELFKVSEVTIRKDLSDLESQQKVIRKYGGAVAIEQNSLQTEKVSNRKFLIGQLASTLVQDNARVIIDSGTTTLAIMPHLHQTKGLVLMTNSLAIANYVNAHHLDIRLILTGGTWDTHSSSMQGQMAEKMINAYTFDLAFIGASGIEAKFGTTTFNELTSLSQSMAKVSEQVVVMAESQKLNSKMPNQELPWSQVSTFITDDQLGEVSKKLISAQNIDVLCVKS